jgi:ubiquinone/menaquinone biosynthesis C-methylase UbiE
MPASHMSAPKHGETTMAQPSYVENLSSMPSPIALLQMASSYWVSKAIHAVAFLGIADLLQGGPKSSVELAHSTRVDAQSLHRLLRVTASVGVFAENREGNFELTPLANYLQTGVPGSVRELTIMLGEDWKWQSWGELLYSVKTGKPAFEHVFGMGLFTYLAQNTEAGELFNQAMGNFTAQQASAVVNAYDFSQFARVVDVAGGNGTLLLAILKANPQPSGVLFDQPAVIKDALKHIESAGLAERCETVAGDFSRVVPQGGDAYLIKQAIHNWDDERAIKILQNCHRAMTPQGKLLVIEMIIPPGNEPFAGKLSDLDMLVCTEGGRERTEAEFRTLFEAAGFKLTNIIPTQSLMNVIEGVQASGPLGRSLNSE